MPAISQHTTVLDAVIPAAGEGTRMRRVTRGKPKELLPIKGIPLIVHTLQEAIEAGAERIFIIVSPQKPEVRAYLTNDALLSVHGRMTGWNNLKRFGIDCIFLTQAEPLGVANAFSLAEAHIGNSDFFAFMPDNYYPLRPSPAEQLIRHYTAGMSCTGILKLTPELLPAFSNSGLVTFEKTGKVTVKITSITEKKAGNFSSGMRTSVYRSIGRGIYSQDFFRTYYDMEHPDTVEWDDLPIIRRLITEGKMDGCILKGAGFDAGNPAGYDAACGYSS